MENRSSHAIVQVLGERIKAYRIDYPMTQKELADKSGVSLRCIQNFEHGQDVQLSNLIKLMKALELADNLAMLIPDISRKPSMYLVDAKRRERVRKSSKKEDAPFRWGDEE